MKTKKKKRQRSDKDLSLPLGAANSTVGGSSKVMLRESKEEK